MANTKISFSFTVDTCLTPEDVNSLRDVGEDDRWMVFNNIFGEDPNIWDAFYEAAIRAFESGEQE